MSKNVKLGNNVLNNVETVQLEDADNAGTWVDFALSSGGGITTTPFVKLAFEWNDMGFPEWVDQIVYVMVKATSTPPKSTSEATVLGTLPITKSKNLCYAEFDLTGHEGKYLFIAAHGYTKNYCQSGYGCTVSGNITTTYNTWSGSTFTDLTNSRQYELGKITASTVAFVCGTYLNED